MTFFQFVAAACDGHVGLKCADYRTCMNGLAVMVALAPKIPKHVVEFCMDWLLEVSNFDLVGSMKAFCRSGEVDWTQMDRLDTRFP